MIERVWRSENQKILVCVDSYAGGVPKGRLYNSTMGDDRFESLSQLLIKTEEILDELQMPQSYTTPRSFSRLVENMDTGDSRGTVHRGTEATFELQILFRQHTSWQGVVVWQEQHREQSFRSVLELILLMDSALRQLEGRVSA